MITGRSMKWPIRSMALFKALPILEFWSQRSGIVRPRNEIQNTMSTANTLPRTILIKQKSTGLALLLSFLFGPLGMLYATVSGGVIMFFISIPIILFTGGLGLLLTIPIGMVWSASSVGSYNNRTLQGI